MLQHEFVHFWAQKYLPRLPTWLNEGLADYFSTMQVTGHYTTDGKGGIKVEVGRAVENRVRVLKRIQELVQGEQNALTRVIQALGAIDIFQNKEATKEERQEAQSLLWGAADHIKKFLVVTNIAAEVLGSVVDKTPEFVNYECSAKQVSKLIDAYIYVVGWETIKSAFLSRMSTMGMTEKAA